MTIRRACHRFSSVLLYLQFLKRPTHFQFGTSELAGYTGQIVLINSVILLTIGLVWPASSDI